MRHQQIVHVLTITDFPLACRKQTLFSSAIFSAGETRAEKKASAPRRLLLSGLVLRRWFT